MSSRLILALILTLWPSLSLAAGARCPDEAGLRSTEWTVSTSLTFANRMPIALRIYWLNYNGVRQFYAIVPPGQSHVQQTYVTHPWVLTDESENCVALYMPTREPGEILVTGERAIAGQPQAALSRQAQAGTTVADKRLVGTWLGLQAGLRFPLACESGEPVRYSADGTYAGPGARGTWQLQDGTLTEIAKEVDAQTGDASAKRGKPYRSRIVWKGPDSFVRTFPDGFEMTFRRCPPVATPAAAGDQMDTQRCVRSCLAASKGNTDPRYHACVEKSCTAKSPARSKAADYLVREQIAAACEKRDGSIEPSSVIERDLDGDGQADLIIHHHGIECSGGGRSIFCGAQACSFHVYVRRGALLTPAGEFMGVETITVEGARIPTIRTFAHGGKPVALRWNGREFRSR